MRSKMTFLHKKLLFGIRLNNTKAQVFLETSVAFVVVVVLLLGITQIFIHLNRSMVKRQLKYQSTRTSLGGAVDYYDAKSVQNRMYVFPEERP